MAKNVQTEGEIFRQAIVQLKFEGSIDPNFTENFNVFQANLHQFAHLAPIIEQRMNSIRSAYHRFSDAVEEASNRLRKQEEAFGYLKKAAETVVAPVAKLSSMFVSFGAVFGGTSLGMGAAIQNLNKYNVELRATASQFTKYGQGISETKNKVEGLANQFQWTREQTLQLMSTFESGFDLADIKAMPSMFDAISEAVGGSAEKVGQMMQALQSIGSKSLAFQDIVMQTFSDSSKSSKEQMGDIQSSALKLIAAGKIGISEAKKLDELAKGGKAMSAEDRLEKQRIDDQAKFFRSMNKLFEDISLAIGQEIMPMAKLVGDYLLSIKSIIIPIAKWVSIIAGTATAFAGLAGSFAGFRALPNLIAKFTELGNFIRTGSNAGGLFGAIRGVLGFGGAAAGGIGGGAAAGAGAGAGAAGGSLLGGAVGTGAAITGAAVAGLAGGNLISRSQTAMNALYYTNPLAMGAGLLGFDIRDNVYKQADDIQNTANAYDKIKPRNESESIKLQRAKRQTEIDADRMRGSWWGLGYFGVGRDYNEDEKKELAQLNEQVRVSDFTQRDKDLSIEHMTATGNRQKEIDYERNMILPLEKEMSDAKFQGLTETADKLNEVIEKRKAELEKIKQTNKEQQELASTLTPYAQTLARVNTLLDQQSQKTEKQLELTRSIVNLGSMRPGMVGQGDSATSLAAINTASQELDMQMKFLKESKEVSRETFDAAARLQISQLDPEKQKAAKEKMSQLDNIRKTQGSGSSEYRKSLAELSANYGINLDYDVFQLQRSAEINATLEKQVSLQESITQIRQGSLNQQQLETSLAESQMNLANSYGFGLKATVQMQQQVVQSLQQQKAIMEGQISDLQASANKLNQDKQKELNAVMSNASLSAADKERAANEIKQRYQVQEFANRNEVLKKQNEIVQATARQAEITKSLREGYISAIAAMNTGQGVFTRIVISQEKRLGSLVAGAPNKIRALRAGSELEGRRESGRFGAGTLTEGAAGEAEKAVLSTYGEYLDAGDIRKGAEVMTGVVDRSKGSVVAAMADNLYGSSQAFEEHKKAAEGANTALTKFSNFISSIFSPIVDDNGKIKSSPTSSNPINDVIKDADEVKKAFIDTLRSVNSPEVISAFRQAMADVAVAAAKEAIPQVLREMRQAQ